MEYVTRCFVKTGAGSLNLKMFPYINFVPGSPPFSQGNLGAAVALVQRAIAIDETVYDAEHPELAMDVDFLGELFDMQVRISN